jgi:hypothetical protein
VQYGQKRPFEPPRDIEISDAQVFDKADLHMPRGGVITGQIVDELGEPMADAVVMAHREAWQSGRRRLTMAGHAARTNDLGQFRLFGLPLGEYYVSASLRTADMSALDVPDAETLQSGLPTTDYAPTYFPGTTSPADAQKVRIGLGQDGHGIDFPLRPVKLASVAGIVLDSEGAPLAGVIVTAIAGRTPPTGVTLSFTTLAEEDGSFTLAHVVPGEYKVQALSVSSGTDDTGTGRPYTEYGSVSVSVGSDPMRGVVIALRKDATARGRVVFEGAPPATALASVRVKTVAAAPESSLLVPPMAVAADGSFEVTGIAGPQLFALDGLPSGWSLKAVTLNNEDVTDRPVEFQPGEVVAGLRMVAAPVSGIYGTVTRSNGSPVRDGTVIIFAQDSQKWNLPTGRWVRGARSDDDGGFRVEDLPAGSYFAVAIDYAPQDQWGDPEFLERLKANATRVRISEGASETIPLKMRER